MEAIAIENKLEITKGRKWKNKWKEGYSLHLRKNGRHMEIKVTTMNSDTFWDWKYLFCYIDLWLHFPDYKYFRHVLEYHDNVLQEGTEDRVKAYIEYCIEYAEKHYLHKSIFGEQNA